MSNQKNAKKNNTYTSETVREWLAEETALVATMSRDLRRLLALKVRIGVACLDHKGQHAFADEIKVPKSTTPRYRAIARAWLSRPESAAKRLPEPADIPEEWLELGVKKVAWLGQQHDAEEEEYERTHETPAEDRAPGSDPVADEVPAPADTNPPPTPSEPEPEPEPEPRYFMGDLENLFNHLLGDVKALLVEAPEEERVKLREEAVRLSGVIAEKVKSAKAKRGAK